MKTINMNSERFAKLALKHITFPNSLEMVVSGEANPETGENPIVTLIHKKGSFFMDGKPMKRISQVSDGNGNLFPVASEPSWKEVAQSALVFLGAKEKLIASRFCADQDESFLRSIGVIQEG